MLRFVSFIFSMLLVAGLSAVAADSAIAIASGNVRLNGSPLVRSSSVFTGDVIETSADSAVLLHAKGSTVQIGASAECSINERGMTLKRGGARVNGPMSIQAGNVTVASNSAKGRFEVSSGTRTIVVTAIREWVKIQVPREVITLRAGESMNFDQDGTPVPPVKSGSRKKLLAASIVGAGAATGWIIASHLEDGRQGCMSPPCRVANFPSGR